MTKVTHVLALVGAAVWAFIATPAGQAVLHQYPVIAGLVGAVSTVLVVYHNPIKAAQ